MSRSLRRQRGSAVAAAESGALSAAVQTQDLLKEVAIISRSVGAQHAAGEEWRNHSRKNEEMEPKQKQCPIMDVTGDGSKVQCCEEQYCIGTWNVRSMNQGKWKWSNRMARVNIDILGISELKQTRMGEFNLNGHYIFYCGQESLRRNGVALMSMKESEMQYLDAMSKMTE